MVAPRINFPSNDLIGMAVLILPGTHADYFKTYFPGLILFGLGMSFVIAPLTKSALAVNNKYSGAASGVNNAVSRIAALLAIALLGAIMSTTFSNHLIKNISHSSLSAKEQQQVIEQKNKLGSIAIPASFDLTTRMTAQDAIDNAFLYAFRMVIGICALLAFISAVLSFFLIHNKKV